MLETLYNLFPAMLFGLTKDSQCGTITELQRVASYPTLTTPKCVFAVQGGDMSAQNRGAYL